MPSSSTGVAESEVGAGTERERPVVGEAEDAVPTDRRLVLLRALKENSRNQQGRKLRGSKRESTLKERSMRTGSLGAGIEIPEAKNGSVSTAIPNFVVKINKRQ